MDYTKSIPISEHVFWVGTFDTQDNFQCNAYLIVIDGKGVIIDPGSVLYFDSFMKKISERIELKNISHIILQHQDPDVCGNIAMLADALVASGNKSFKILTHSRTSAVVRHYGANLKFESTNRIPEEKIFLGLENELEFIHTPYLHAPGAIATYFDTDKILFSSDIFGGMTENWNLFAAETYFEDISTFHKEYMPAKELLLFTMTQFERYDINKIAPQHGSVINKEQAKTMIEAFKDFECGLFIDRAFRKELQEARKKIEEQNQIMSKDLSMAGHFQQTLLPDKKMIAWKNGVDLAYDYEPYSQVSGDFLIIDKIDAHHLGIMVVDVVDHGVMSGLATIQIKTLFDEYKSTSLSPADVLRTINDKAFSIAENDIFFTALYAIYDLKNSKIEFAFAGGIPAIYYKADRNEKELISLVGTSLGVTRGDDCRIDTKSLSVGQGDILILQTDGLMDSTNESNVPFDHVRSQKKFMVEIKKERSAQQILDSIMKKAEIHKGLDKSFDDDVTFAVLKIAKG
jgi:serine phosphatase RsbU (regulator of sigma subunit)